VIKVAGGDPAAAAHPGAIEGAAATDAPTNAAASTAAADEPAVSPRRPGETLYQRRLRKLLARSPAATAFLGLIGYLLMTALLYHHLEGWGMLRSVYFSLIVLTTVGYGDVAPVTPGGRICTCFFVMVGLSLIAYLLGIIGQAVISQMQAIAEAAEAAVEEGTGVDLNGSDSNTKPTFTKRQLNLLRSVACIFGCIGLGMVFFVSYEGFTWVDAFYLSTITVTTVGFGDIYPTTKGGRIFAIFWVPLGTIVVGQSIGSFVDAYLESKQEEFRKRMLDQKISGKDLFEADTDGEGQISEAEFVVFKLKRMGLITDETIEPIQKEFARLDADGSGYLTREEVL